MSSPDKNIPDLSDATANYYIDTTIFSLGQELPQRQFNEEFYRSFAEKEKARELAEGIILRKFSDANAYTISPSVEEVTKYVQGYIHYKMNNRFGL